MVEDRECVAHAAVRFAGNDAQGFLLIGDALFFRNSLEVVHDVGHLHAVEIVDLAAAQNGGQYLVLLGSGENEDGVCGRLFKSFEESVEGLRGEHVYLVDNEHLVASHLRRHLYLLDEHAHIVDRVIGGGVEFIDVERALLGEGAAALALVAGFAVGRGVLAVDGFGEDACAGGFAHAARPAEEEGVCQFAGCYRVFQGCGQRALSHDAVEGSGAVFSGRNDVVVHLIYYVFLAKLRKKGRKRPLSYKTFARAAQIIAIFSEIFFTNPVKNLPKSVIVFIICAEKVCYKVCNACYKVCNTC